MELAKVTATELRLKTRDLVERVKFKGERLLVENFGRPMIVMISVEDYERVTDSLAAEKQAPLVLDRPARARGGKKRQSTPPRNHSSTNISR